MPMLCAMHVRVRVCVCMRTYACVSTPTAGGNLLEIHVLTCFKVLHGASCTPACSRLCRWGCEEMKIVCLRQRKGLFDGTASIVFTVHMPEISEDFLPEPSEPQQQHDFPP